MVLSFHPVNVMKIKKLLLTGFLLCALLSCLSFADDLVQITKVRSFKSDIYEDIVIYTNGNVEPQLMTLDSPKRLVLAFPNTNICNTVSMKGKTSLVRKIQAYQFDYNTVYVTVEPNKKLNYSYGTVSGNNEFVLEFSQAASWSVKTIESSTPDATANEDDLGTPNMPRETFQCEILSSGEIEEASKEDITKNTPASPVH
jgi:AMIN domain